MMTLWRWRDTFAKLCRDEPTWFFDC